MQEVKDGLDTGKTLCQRGRTLYQTHLLFYAMHAHTTSRLQQTFGVLPLSISLAVLLWYKVSSPIVEDFKGSNHIRSRTTRNCDRSCKSRPTFGKYSLPKELETPACMVTVSNLLLTAEDTSRLFPSV